MSTASKFYPFDRTHVFYNLRDWESMLGKIVESNPEAADSISQVMFEIVSTMQERGRFLETVNTVKLGLEWIFPYTSTHTLSFTLFLFDAEEALRDSGGLETLLTAAVDRAFSNESKALAGIEETSDQRIEGRRRSENRGTGKSGKPAKQGRPTKHKTQRRTQNE